MVSLLVYGQDAPMRFALAILRISRDSLLLMSGPEILHFFKALPPLVLHNIDLLFEIVHDEF